MPSESSRHFQTKHLIVVFVSASFFFRNEVGEVEENLFDKRQLRKIKVNLMLDNLELQVVLSLEVMMR